MILHWWFINWLRWMGSRRTVNNSTGYTMVKSRKVFRLGSFWLSANFEENGDSLVTGILSSCDVRFRRLNLHGKTLTTKNSKFKFGWRGPSATIFDQIPCSWPSCTPAITRNQKSDCCDYTFKAKDQTPLSFGKCWTHVLTSCGLNLFWYGINLNLAWFKSSGLNLVSHWLHLRSRQGFWFSILSFYL